MTKFIIEISSNRVTKKHFWNIFVSTNKLINNSEFQIGKNKLTVKIYLFLEKKPHTIIQNKHCVISSWWKFLETKYVLILLNGSVSMEVTPGMSFLSVQQPHTDNASILADDYVSFKIVSSNAMRRHKCVDKTSRE